MRLLPPTMAWSAGPSAWSLCSPLVGELELPAPPGVILGVPPGGRDAGLAACDRAKGLARFERLGGPFEAARTREHLAALEPATAARSLLEGALSTDERLDCTPHQQAVQARLIELA